MITNFFKTPERKTIAIYFVTTAVIYGAFWLGYYFFEYLPALITAAVIVLASGIIFAVYRKSTWAPVLLVFAVSLGIGILFSAFFTAVKIIPSRFFGLVLIFMLIYKILQAMLVQLLSKSESTGHKKKFLIFCTVLEFIAGIAVIIFAFTGKDNANAGLLWQIFFMLLTCIFYSCGQFALKSNVKQSFWRQAATAYLLGFVLLFVIVVLLIISILSNDGSILDGLDLSPGGKKSKKQKSAKIAAASVAADNTVKKDKANGISKTYKTSRGNLKTSGKKGVNIDVDGLTDLTGEINNADVFEGYPLPQESVPPQENNIF